MIWRPNVKKSMNLVSIWLSVVFAVPVCPFREKQESVMVHVSRCLWDFQKIILLFEFPCLHYSFQSWPVCRAAVVVSDTYMFVIYIECFLYSRAALAAGLCCSCQTFN